MTQPSFSDKVIVITGAASGIGAATAALFGKSGARVVLVDCDAAGAQGATAIERAGGKAIFVTADVTSEAAMRNAMDAAVGAFGRIDVLINNAGMIIRHERLEDWPLEEFRRVIDINLTGQFIAAKAAAPFIARHAKNGGGNIVSTASIGAIGPVAYSPCYAAAKAGVMALVRSLVPQLSAQNIRINALLPGMVDTPFIGNRSPAVIGSQATRYPHGLLQAKDLSLAVRYLAGQAEMTGKFFAVNQTEKGARLALVEDPPRQLEWTEQPY